MSFEKQADAERGHHLHLSSPTSQTSSFMSPSEKFLLFRDVAFVCIILLHLGTTLFAIPALATHTAAPDTHPHLVIIIVLGVLVPIFATVGYRDRIPTSKVTSAICFEFGWCAVIMTIDFIVAVAQSSLKDAAKTSIALTWLQTIAMMVYTIGLSLMVLLQHKRFPEVSIWSQSVQSVQWLRSPHPVNLNAPASPSYFVSPTPKGVIPPWQLDPDMQEIKLSSGNKEAKLSMQQTFLQSTISPDPAYGYVNAHPFWQERVQRQAVVEDDMSYIIQRYGLNIEADKLAKSKSHSHRPSGVKGHGRKGSIRDLEISRPVPIPSTVRRANTLTGHPPSHPPRGQHTRGASLQTRPTPASLTLELPPSNLDVPVDVIPAPEPIATRAIHINASTRALGLAGRTLIGTSRPAKKATISSKPLPSPPALDDEEEDSLKSLKSAGGNSGNGSGSFVMGLAQRVQISASKVRPLMIATPKATEHSINRSRDDDEEDIAF